MFGLSLGHLIILLFVAMLFGPKRVSDLGGKLGKSLKGMKDSLDGVKAASGYSNIEAARSAMRESAETLREQVNPFTKKPDADDAPKKS